MNTIMYMTSLIYETTTEGSSICPPSIDAMSRYFVNATPFTFYSDLFEALHMYIYVLFNV